MHMFYLSLFWLSVIIINGLIASVVLAIISSSKLASIYNIRRFSNFTQPKSHSQWEADLRLPLPPLLAPITYYQSYLDSIQDRNVVLSLVISLPINGALALFSSLSIGFWAALYLMHAIFSTLALISFSDNVRRKSGV